MTAMTPPIAKMPANFKVIEDGAIFGRLTYRSEAPRKSKKRRVFCECICGSGLSDYDLGNLRSGHTVSCGCAKGGVIAGLSVGDTFGNLEVVELRDFVSGKRKEALFKCHLCDNSKVMQVSVAKRDSTIGCGCSTTVHGEYGTDLYRVWSSMKSRCNTEYGKESYIAKSISVCDEWSASFYAFSLWATANGWAKGLQIDRIDNNAGYHPDNCRITTASKNCQNRSTSYKWFIKGLAFESAREAAKSLGVHVSVIHSLVNEPVNSDCWKERKYANFPASA